MPPVSEPPKKVEGAVVRCKKGTKSCLEELCSGKVFINKRYLVHKIKGEPELTDTFNLLINVKLRML